MKQITHSLLIWIWDFAKVLTPNKCKDGKMLSRTKKRLVFGISFISLLSVFHHLDVNSWISRFTYSVDVREKVNLSLALDSLSIIAFMRPDFVEKILSSVDFPITKLIVIVNKHSDAAEKENH